MTTIGSSPPALGGPPAATPDPAPEPRTWQHVVCGVLLVVLAGWEIAMIPVKPGLLTHLTLSTVITTDPVAEVGLGARAAYNHHRAMWLPPIWFVAAISTLKWHVVAFWAGRLWGHEALEHWSGKSRRAQAVTRAIVWLGTRWPIVSIAMAYILMPLASLVYATVGAAELSWKRFLKIDIVAAMLSTFGWIYLGFAYGHQASDLLDRFGKYATAVAIAIGVLLVAFLVWRRFTKETRQIKAEAKQQAREAAERRIREAKAVKLAAKQARRADRQR